VDQNGLDPTQDELLAYGSTPEAQLSLNALSGSGVSEILRMVGHIAKRGVSVLVDGGSTHNFVQAHVAQSLSLSQSPTVPLKVLVGSGEELICNKVCKGVEIAIQEHTFILDLFVLDMGGTDIVLGAQWLKQLGPVLMDYQKLTIKFMH
jgi:hypothetical protein